MGDFFKGVWMESCTFGLETFPGPLKAN